LDFLENKAASTEGKAANARERTRRGSCGTISNVGKMGDEDRAQVE
jgi:hypothetical protein